MQSEFTFTKEMPVWFCVASSLNETNHRSGRQLTTRSAHHGDFSPSLSISNVRRAFGQPSIGASENSFRATLSTVFNADAAVSRLPAELVVKIFLSGAWTKWHELLSLTHICQHWRDVARGTPQLWADAVASIFQPRARVDVHSIRCLPTLLSWSEPYPLRLELDPFPASSPVSILTCHFNALRPHYSQLRHLAVRVFRMTDVVVLFEELRSGMSSLESLHIEGLMSTLSPDERVFLTEPDLPRLHTLSIPGAFFTGAVILKTLKSITLDDHPCSHQVFLDALEKCPPGLESLTIEELAHPNWVVEESTSLRPPVRFPALRRLKIALCRLAPPPPDFIPGVLLPSDVAIDLDWHDCRGNTHALLPKYLIGLHAPPFFDALCLFVSGSENVAILKCFVGGAERLSVQKIIRQDEELHTFLRDYMSAAVTEIAVHFDLDTPPGCLPLVADHTLSSFLRGFPNLRRLDLLGKKVRKLKLQMAEVFLDRMAQSISESTTAPAGCLAFAFEVEERPLKPDERRNRYMDELRYTIDYQLAILREQLDNLEALLKTRLAAGGPRLHRLELCITLVRAGPRPYTVAVGAPYYRVADVPPSSHWTRKLSWVYLPRFQALVGEVVFFGQPHVLSGGVRQLPSQPNTRMRSREDGSRNTRRRGR